MVIVIDPQIAGISGDMLLSSLVELGADKNKIIDGIKKCEKFIPNSTIKKMDFQKIQKNRIESTQLILESDENISERKGIEIKKAILDSVNELNLSINIKMSPRVLQFEAIVTAGAKRKAAIAKDSPQCVSIIQAEEFELREYVDASDLLSTHQSIQVGQSLSG